MISKLINDPFIFPGVMNICMLYLIYRIYSSTSGKYEWENSVDPRSDCFSTSSVIWVYNISKGFDKHS